MIEAYIKGNVDECKKFIKTLYDSGWKYLRMTDFSPLEFYSKSSDGIIYMEMIQ